MRHIMESHSQVVCMDENSAYKVLANPAKLKVVLKKYSAKSYVGFKIPRWTEQLEWDVLSDLPTDPDYPGKATRFYDSQPLIFMLRDPRDVVCSMLRYKVPGGVWIDVAGRPILAHKAMQYSDFRDKYAKELTYVILAHDHRVAAGALYWKYKTESLFEYQAKRLPLLVVRYEELCQQPELVMHRVVEFLGLEWENTLVAPESVLHRDLDSSGDPIREGRLSRGIEAKSVGQYASILTADQLDDIKDITGDVAPRLGYRL